ncbi:MAG TPA: SURF1 family protein [Micromonosporaceae bacterium]|nr:SURF1 family protein [Micromonosporaceae bacterium]
MQSAGPRPWGFLVTPRWLGLAALIATLSTVMVGLGLWQLDRYHQRSTINARIDAATAASAAPIEAALPAPAPGGGAAPDATTAWTMVTVTGVYDPAHELLARGRTVDGRVGFEVLTPLRRPDGSAVLVDRGWLPPAPAGMGARPDVPAAPTGPVTVVGRVHLTESRSGGVDQVNGQPEVRRIGVPAIARTLPYPVYGAYLLLDTQTPAAGARLVTVPVAHENAAQNAGYVVQWWLLAGIVLVGFGYLARREAADRREATNRRGAAHQRGPADRGAAGGPGGPSTMDEGGPHNVRDIVSA